MKQDIELRKVQKYGKNKVAGGSLNIVIPAKFTAVLGLKKHDYVKMTLVNKTIVLEKYVP